MEDSPFRDKVILAPMMTGGNRTFRRLAHEFGADILGGEMAFSHKVAKGDGRELALISARHEAGFFSAQLSGRNVDVLVKAAQMVGERGAQAIDLNAGCPMHFVTEHGVGAALLDKKSLNRLGKLVDALKKSVPLPITVKIRAGFSSKKPVPLSHIAQVIESAGADAIAVHARFRDEFYDTPANWQHIKEVVDAVKIPVIGNGDVRSHTDATRMRTETGCTSVMIGRAALQRPWIFREIKENRTIDLTPVERWAMIEKHFAMIRETFGEKMGFKLARWHAGWYCRWREDQKVLRTTWETLEPTAWETWAEEIKQITLAGPDTLPPPSLKHEEIEAG